MPRSASRRSLLAMGGLALLASACTPTVRVEVAPISIYAKLEHDVRVSLAEDVKSLIQHVGESFGRIRVGIGPKQPAQMDMADFVLGKFTPDQQLILTQNLDAYVQGLELLLSRGIEPAMNQLNRRDPK